MLIVNPQAGLGLPVPPFMNDLLGIHQKHHHHFRDRLKSVDEILRLLKARGLPVTVNITQAQGHATTLARQCVADGYDLVIAAGGDGTVNEVINGLAGSDTAFGVIPMGTVNIFALQCGLPQETEAACDVLAAGHCGRIDLGYGNGRYFSCMAGIGFDAYVIQQTETHPQLKKKLGALAYLLMALWKVFRYPFQRIVIRLDDKGRKRRGYFVLVSNGKYYSGKKILAEQADLTDGLLDVCVFHHRNLWGLFLYLAGLRPREALKDARLRTYQCRTVTVFKRGKHPVHVDAELLGHTPVTFEIRPRALKVVLPQNP